MKKFKLTKRALNKLDKCLSNIERNITKIESFDSNYGSKKFQKYECELMLAWSALEDYVYMHRTTKKQRLQNTIDAMNKQERSKHD